MPCWENVLPPKLWSDIQTGNCSLEVISNPLQMLSTSLMWWGIMLICS